MISSHVLFQVVLSDSSKFAALESAAEFCVAYLMFAFDVSIKVCPQTKSFCTGWALEWLCVRPQMLAVGVFNTSSTSMHLWKNLLIFSQSNEYPRTVLALIGCGICHNTGANSHGLASASFPIFLHDLLQCRRRGQTGLKGEGRGRAN
jgi:hypothetical protein